MPCMILCFLGLAAFAPDLAAAARSRGVVGTERSQALLQTWGEALDGIGGHSSAQDTPVTRAVTLLKDMQKTLQKDMSEDEELYGKLACWCNNNNYAKKEAIATSEQTISNLEASNEGLTAKVGGLKTKIGELETQVSDDKNALAEATALRKTQQQEFHGGELDSTQAIENLKAAIEVLSKHHGKPPKSSVAGGAIFKTEKDSWESLLAVRSSTARAGPWSAEQEASHAEHPLDEFMRHYGFDDMSATSAADTTASGGFLQQPEAQPQVRGAAGGWSQEEEALFGRGLRSASAFVQRRQGAGYTPAYNSQSGEIFGILKQMKEEMEAGLSESQKREQGRAASFSELRSAKAEEIKGGEKASETAEDELATSANALAEGKEDLSQEKAALAESQKFLKNLEETCADSGKKFEARKSARLEEIKAVSETIEILTEDEARDATKGTYSLLQSASGEGRRARRRRQEAAALLRRTARKASSPNLAFLATSVELDAFSVVKKAIDKMVAMLKVQQEDEVKKTDFCKSEIQENEMTTAKTQDHKSDLEAKSTKLTEDIKALDVAITEAKAQIAQLQLDLQRASEDRKAENLQFQSTVQDQTLTVEVLKKALDRLANYYDKEAFLQRAAGSQASDQGQTPPVPQMEYKPSKGAEGVMQLIEKLVQEAQGLIASSRGDEAAAQAAYEQTVEDTNASVADLQKEVTTKSKAKTQAEKDKRQTESDVADASSELDGLAKYNAELHSECDYVLKNFGARQQARAEEIEALQQARQILSGASFA
mmetsp:Transcript_43648/g.126008  ORF Transcript_43648/g.126008 Transcript_43648/m.126008 type:complete len:772 (+) Transcript_43648:66-2381(+)